MIVHKWGITEYKEATIKMQKVHESALADKKNHLILTSHKACFTVGRDGWDKKWDVEAIKCDRGGSITAHGEGQNIYYFCFQVASAIHFFRKVVLSFKDFFDSLNKDIKYRKNNPGFYIQNRKLCSLGFRYKEGVSLHGVALNVDIDQSFHSKITPCNLHGFTTTSLANEDIHISCDEVNKIIVSEILKNFNERL